MGWWVLRPLDERGESGIFPRSHSGHFRSRLALQTGFFFQLENGCFAAVFRSRSAFLSRKGLAL